jgi:hypothetical protein
MIASLQGDRTRKGLEPPGRLPRISHRMTAFYRLEYHSFPLEIDVRGPLA